jgi:hypothetical protein
MTVFEPSFDWKECGQRKFIIQKFKLHYITISVWLQDYVHWLKI